MSESDFTFHFTASEYVSSNVQNATMAQIIADMQNMEDSAVAAATSTDTKAMITKFRKLYYNSKGWNEILVPGTTKIAVFPASSVKNAMLKSHEIALPVAENSAGQTQYVKYDIAHIFAVLDAANHNGTLSPLSVFPEGVLAKLPDELKACVPAVHDRLMACGWLGDLSEIIGEFYLQKATTTAAKQRIINQFGIYYKNLANVDAMVMVDKYQDELASTAGKKLSSLFVDYYGTDGKGGTREERQTTRYQTFAGMIGLKCAASGFSNTELWVQEQTANLRTCAAFYLANKCLDKSASVKEELKSVLIADIEAFLKNKETLKTELEKQLAQFLYDEMAKPNGLENDLVTLAICFLMWQGCFDVSLSVDKLLYSFAEGLSSAIDETKSAV